MSFEPYRVSKCYIQHHKSSLCDETKYVYGHIQDVDVDVSNQARSSEAHRAKPGSALHSQLAGSAGRPTLLAQAGQASRLVRFAGQGCQMTPLTNPSLLQSAQLVLATKDVISWNNVTKLY